MMARNRINRAAAPRLYPKESIPDKQLAGADGRRLKRGDVVRNPERFSKALRTTVPSCCGRIVDIYRRGDQYLVEVVLDGVDAAAGRAVFQADRVRRSQARIRTSVDAMPSKAKVC